MIDSIRKAITTQATSKPASQSNAAKPNKIEMDNETQTFLSTLSELSEKKKLDVLLEKLVINSLMQNVGLSNINEPKTAILIQNLKSTLQQHPEIQQHLKNILQKF